jgi:peptidoglycan/xylan/chitin deacetylase (PgdA/CDA1 family)
MQPPVLAYHLVDQRMDAGIAWISPRRFERQIAWLAENGYRSLTVSELLHRDNHAGAKQIVITFDDGYQSLLKYALPILSRYDFRATVFVVTAYVGQTNGWDVKFFLPRLRHLDWGELRALLAAGWEIGSHSLQHDYLPLLSDHQLQRDLSLSRQMLQDHLGAPAHHLSLPFGRGDSRVYQAAKKAGYASISTLGDKKSKIEKVKSENAICDVPIILRRGVYLLDSLQSFKRRVEAPPDSKWQYWRQRAISACAMGTVIVKIAQKKLGLYNGNTNGITI